MDTDKTFAPWLGWNGSASYEMKYPERLLFRMVVSKNEASEITDAEFRQYFMLLTRQLGVFHTYPSLSREEFENDFLKKTVSIIFRMRGRVEAFKPFDEFLPVWIGSPNGWLKNHIQQSLKTQKIEFP